eukprot:CAMPEP_0170612730 /NCGR_PEP_ID=MMETSP0224-20130122/23881_1 /TAXON_ID=285029 /ORGANISM="Togula jolla, Strain CCCM 725" /LENGTH=249 /DNA_ID=CAMNT_0010938257 /DNA_START=1 /DNA_END=746 /DNA_ORIENTATION=+
MAMLFVPRFLMGVLLGGIVPSKAAPGLMRKAWDTGSQMSLYAEVEAVAENLQPGDVAIRDSLERALAYLRAADAALLAEVIGSPRAERQHIAERAARAARLRQAETGTSGKERGLMEMAMSCYVDERSFSESMVREIHDRKEEILPALRELASEDVLGDCQLATKSINAVIHNHQSPEVAKDTAYRLLRAVGKARYRFMRQMAKAGGVRLSKDRYAEAESPPTAIAAPSIAKPILDMPTIAMPTVDVSR